MPPLRCLLDRSGFDIQFYIVHGSEFPRLVQRQFPRLLKLLGVNCSRYIVVYFSPDCGAITKSWWTLMQRFIAPNGAAKNRDLDGCDGYVSSDIELIIAYFRA